MLFRRIPAGVGSTGDIHLLARETDRMLVGGARWAVGEGYGEERDFCRIEEQGRMSGADSAQVSDKAKKRQWNGRSVIDDLARRGVLIRSPSLRGVTEEAPGAYKDVSAVVSAADAAALARKVARLNGKTPAPGRGHTARVEQSSAILFPGVDP